MLAVVDVIITEKGLYYAKSQVLYRERTMQVIVLVSASPSNGMCGCRDKLPKSCEHLCVE